MSNLRSTSALIDQLASDLQPVGKMSVSRRIFAALAGGSLISLAIVLWLWGIRPDFVTALPTASFWAKELFPAALALAGIFAMLRLARPEGNARTQVFWAIGAAFIMTSLAGAQLLSNAPQLWTRLIMGKTAAVCPWLIVLLALPILVGALAVMRRMAPTRLTGAGGAAGLAAGSLSALVYSVSCDESTMPFVLVWYGGAILVSVLVGAVLGRRILRW